MNQPHSHISKGANERLLRESLAGHKKADATKTKALEKKMYGSDYVDTRSKKEFKKREKFKGSTGSGGKDYLDTRSK